MAPSPFNSAQQAIIDDLGRYGRPGKPQIRVAWAQCRELGREISAQEIGRYYANRAAEEEGRPRSTRKTPKQLGMLEESFADEPFPVTLELIGLVHDTGLSRKQVQAWFQYQRQKCVRNGETLFTRNEDTDPNDAAKLWRDYYNDPDTFVRAYFPHRHGESDEEEVGEESGQEDSEREESEREDSDQEESEREDIDQEDGELEEQ